MSVSVFVDTNLLVYARDASEPKKQKLAHAWLVEIWSKRAGRISIQILNEYYVTVTRKLKPGLKAEDARRDVTSLLAWKPAVLDAELVQRAWTIEERHKLSYWDALVVAAALSARCDFVLTEDLADGSSVSGIEILDPFKHDPKEILG